MQDLKYYCASILRTWTGRHQLHGIHNYALYIIMSIRKELTKSLICMGSNRDLPVGVVDYKHHIMYQPNTWTGSCGILLLSERNCAGRTT